MRRVSAEDAADGRVAVFSECADGGAGVDDLEGVERRGQRGDHVGRGHGKGDGSGLENGMAAGKQLFGIDVGNGAGGGDFEVAADQVRADGGAGQHGCWLRRRVGVRRLESDEPPTPPAAMVARLVPAICCCQSGWLPAGIRS